MDLLADICLSNSLGHFWRHRSARGGRYIGNSCCYRPGRRRRRNQPGCYHGRRYPSHTGCAYCTGRASCQISPD